MLYTVLQHYKLFPIHFVTWLSKGGYGVHHVDTVCLSGNDQTESLECLGVDNEGVAPGR